MGAARTSQSGVGVAGQPLKPWPAGLAVKRLEARSPKGSRTAGVVTNRLTALRLTAGPGSGHAHHPHHPQEAHRGNQAHQAATVLSQGTR